MADSDSSDTETHHTNTTISHSSSSVTVLPQNHPVSVKLGEGNFLIWRQQILAAVRGYGLESFLTGDEQAPSRLLTTPGSTQRVINPDFVTWNRQDQLLSSWIQSSLSESAMILVVGLGTTKDIWKALETNFASQSKAKIMQHKLQLQTIKKDSLPMTDFLSKVKSCCDLLGAAGCKVTEDDQILYILGGLGTEYDSIMVSVTSRTEPWSVQELSSLLLSFESRIESQKNSAITLEGSQPSLNLSHTPYPRKDGNSQYGKGSKFEGRGGRSFRGRGGRGYGNKLVCQLCQKPGHAADKCWYRYEQNTPQNSNNGRQQQYSQSYNSGSSSNPSANVAQARIPQAPPFSRPQPEYSFETPHSTSWYPDSGATNHISNDLNNLNINTEYTGGSSHQGNNPQGFP